MKVQLSESEVQVVIDATAVALQLHDLKRTVGSKNTSVIKKVFDKFLRLRKMDNFNGKLSKREIEAINESTCVAIMMMEKGMVNEECQNLLPLFHTLRDKFQKMSGVKVTSSLVSRF